MKRPLILLLLLTAVICAAAQKQHRAAAHVKKTAVNAKMPAANGKNATASASAHGLKIYKQMLDATAKVMFIDSVVVNKADFMSRIPLNNESGELWLANPKADFANHLGAYRNEFGDRCIIAQGDSAHSTLCTQTLLGEKWSKPAPITDFDEATYPLQNYPFLAADGITLFFSAEGEESMGGRDIFMSTFDSDNAKWYKPQNYGLPFNSTANDYLLAIDDLDTLGWLVTDRRQPEGKVCIYTFVPTETRLNFDDDDLSDNELQAYARLLSIRSTWKFGNRNAALKRRDAMLARMSSKRGAAKTMRFVVNDKTVITSPSQFRNGESRKLYSQVEELRRSIEQAETGLGTWRKAYHNGNRSLRQNILKAEKDLEQQRTDLHNLEKRIRRLELQ